MQRLFKVDSELDSNGKASVLKLSKGLLSKQLTGFVVYRVRLTGYKGSFYIATIGVSNKDILGASLFCILINEHGIPEQVYAIVDGVSAWTPDGKQYLSLDISITASLPTYFMTNGYFNEGYLQPIV